MNGCLEKKMFLGNLENTQITPRHKNNNKGNKENYRPVSILLKVLERLIHWQPGSSKEPKSPIFVTGFKKNNNMLYWWLL